MSKFTFLYSNDEAFTFTKHKEYILNSFCNFQRSVKMSRTGFIIL